LRIRTSAAILSPARAMALTITVWPVLTSLGRRIIWLSPPARS